MRIEHTRASFACGCSKEVWPDTSTRIEEDLQERLTAIFFLLLIFAAEIVFAFTADQPNRYVILFAFLFFFLYLGTHFCNIFL